MQRAASSWPVNLINLTMMLLHKQSQLATVTAMFLLLDAPRYPADTSTVAPGMCVEVDVCFTPDSLGDYEDAFAVETPVGKFKVHLRAQRPHPNLTLPGVLQVRPRLFAYSK